MRLVLDTNCVVSAFLWGGAPRQIVDAAVEGRCRLFTCGALLAELEEVLGREKFRPRFLAVQTSVAELLAEYCGQVTVVHAASIPPTITSDPDDDQVLACAWRPGLISSSPETAICSGSSSTRTSRSSPRPRRCGALPPLPENLAGR